MIRSIKNQYLGINAHLHSYWQAESKWSLFHNYPVGQLMAALRRQLLPMGYTAELEQSLQIRRVGDNAPRRPRADIIVRDLKLDRSSPTALSGGIGLAEFHEDAIDTEYPFSAVAIRKKSDVIGWLELLSPSNKAADALAYITKRRMLWEQKIVLIELDYLHETPSTFNRVPDYTKGEAGS